MTSQAKFPRCDWLMFFSIVTLHLILFSGSLEIFFAYSSILTHAALIMLPPHDPRLLALIARSSNSCSSRSSSNSCSSRSSSDSCSSRSSSNIVVIVTAVVLVIVVVAAVVVLVVVTGVVVVVVVMVVVVVARTMN